MKRHILPTALAVSLLVSLQSAWAGSLAAPNAGDAVALPDSLTGVEYVQYLGFSGGAPFYDGDGEPYFTVQVVSGELPASLSIGGARRENVSRLSVGGTPEDEEAGDYAFTVRVTDRAGDSAVQAFTLAVVENPNHRPVIESRSPEAFCVHVEPSEAQVFSVAASDPDGVAVTCTWSVYDEETSDPVPGFEGVVSNSISFSSAKEGWYSVSVAVSDGYWSIPKFWNLHVLATEPLAGPDGAVVALPSATTGFDYGENLGFSGGTPFYDEEDGSTYFGLRIVDGELPAGLGLVGSRADNVSGVAIEGWCDDDEAGDYAFTIRLTDGSGASVEQAFTLTVVENPNHAPEIESFSPERSSVRVDPDGTQTFSVTVSDPDDDDDVTCTWRVWDNDADEYVPGLEGVVGESFDFAVTNEGWYVVSVTARDKGGRSDSKRWDVRVAPATPLAAPGGAVVALPDAMTGVEYDVKLGFSGGTPFYDMEDEPSPYFEVRRDGNLPEDMGCFGRWSEDASNLSLSGTATDGEAGDYAFTVRVTDGSGAIVEQAFTLRVVANPNHAPAIASFSPDHARIRLAPGEVQTFSVTASDPDGDKLAYVWSVYDDALGDDLPGFGGVVGPSLDFSATNLGYYCVSVVASDGARSDSRSWEVYVVDRTPLAAPDAGKVVALPGATTGVGYEEYLEFSGGTPFYDEYDDPYFEIALVDGELPKSLSVSGRRNETAAILGLEGDPLDGEAGDYAFTLRVTDGAGASVEQAFTLRIALNPDLAPVLDALSPEGTGVTVYAGSTKTFSVTASDPEGNALAYGWLLERERRDEESGGTEWVPVPGSGEEGASFAFSPAAGESGACRLSVTISDGARHTTVEWRIDVVPPVASYTVVFNANGGTGSMAAQSILRDASAKLRANAFAKSGCVFLGWAKSSTGAVAFANGASAKNLAAAGGRVTLYAKWAKKSYKVKFAANGGTLPAGKKAAAQKMAYGKAAALRRNVFVRKGFVFAGWAVKKGGGIAYGNGQTVKNLRTDGGTTTLYAVWAKPAYKVEFCANGGTGTMAAEAMTYGKAKKLSANAFKAPKGMKFAGWAKSKALAKKGKVAYKNKKAVKNLVTTGKTVKLFAVWKK